MTVPDEARVAAPADRRRSNWWPTAVMAAGVGFVVLAVLPALVSGPSNPYAAVMALLLGLFFAGIAVALAAYDVARTVLSRLVSAAIAIAAAVPVRMPAFQTVGSSLEPVILYVFAIGVVVVAVRRTLASVVFLVLTAIGPVGLLLASVLA